MLICDISMLQHGSVLNVSKKAGGDDKAVNFRNPSKKLSKLTLRFVTPLIFFLLINLNASSVSYGGIIQEETYKRLGQIRDEKKAQLSNYLEKIRSIANAIKSDSVMLEFFHIKQQFYQLQKTTRPPEALVRKIAKLKEGIQEHYIHNYIIFYDILFVGRSGDIFYTIRKQSDYHKNIFQGKLAETALAMELKNFPRQSFVDYRYYFVSDEPSAFLIVPVMKEKAISGWFIFQCAINNINHIFAQEKELGATGEVFLVNKQDCMLTDSRFYGYSTILKKHLSHENIAGKFKERMGQKIVVDYRGNRVLSSFEVYNILNEEWLLIAKINEDEIITNHYKKNRHILHPILVNAFEKEKPTYLDLMPISGQATIVDMDEFRKVNHNEKISTFGVSTCTAVIVSLPKKFAYVAHISNLDRIYGGQTTDLLSNIFKKIKTFDIYKYEIRDLRVILVANHCETVTKVIDLLVDEGIFLSQIKFMYNCRAKYANLLYDYTRNQTSVEWMIENESSNMFYQRASDVHSLGSLMQLIIHYSNEK